MSHPEEVDRGDEYRDHELHTQNLGEFLPLHVIIDGEGIGA